MSPPRVALAAVTLALALPAAAHAATWSVDDTTDTPVGQACAGTSGCSLREAITSANAAGGADDIVVAAGTYTLSHGQLEADDDLTITGAGDDATTIDANHASRALVANAAVTLRDLTIRNGQAGNAPAQTTAYGGAVLGVGALVVDGVTLADNTANGSDNSYGGAIYTTGSLLVQDSWISGNRAIADGSAGGALYVDNSTGYLHVVDSTLADNLAGATTVGNTGGGAIYASTADLQISGSQLSHNRATTSTNSASGGAILTGYGVTASITDSTLGSNSADGGNGAGGALFLGGPAAFTISRSTFVGNEAVGSGPSELGQGGAIASSPYSGGTLHIENSTLTGNLATGWNTSGAIGGALYAGLPASIEASTLTNNEARILGGGSGTGAGGGLAATDFSAAVTVTVHGSIIAGNTQATGDDCAYGTLDSTGGNVLYVDSAAPSSCGRMHSGSPDVATNTPHVGPLGDHGGPTPTMPLLTSSPAFDLYDSGCPATDQRGVARPQGPACDAGAVEMVPPAPPVSPVTTPVCADGLATTPFNTPVSVTLRCSDTVWSWELVGLPAHGTLGPISSAGTIAYTPDAGFSGPDAFRYRAIGADGPSAPATVTIQVGPGPAQTAASTSATVSGSGCAARSATIRLNPRGVRLVRATASVDGVPAEVAHTGQRWTASFELRGARGQKVTVTIRGRRSDGGLLKRTRTLTVC